MPHQTNSYLTHPWGSKHIYGFLQDLKKGQFQKLRNKFRGVKFQNKWFGKLSWCNYFLFSSLIWTNWGGAEKREEKSLGKNTGQKVFFGSKKRVNVWAVWGYFSKRVSSIIDIFNKVLEKATKWPVKDTGEKTSLSV